MNRKIVVHAPNVHVGGGLLLLKSLIEAAHARQLGFLALDARVGNRILIPPDTPCLRVARSPTGRLAAEFALRKHARADDVVLSFGNLPPLFRLDAHVVLFLQNRLLVETNLPGVYGLGTGFRLGTERLWFRAFRSNVDEFIVQTPSMAAKLRETAGPQQSVIIAPFMKEGGRIPRRAPMARGSPLTPTYDFVYVSSSAAHKNHEKLVRAWRVLAAEGLFPTLQLSLDKKRDAPLCAWVESQAAEFGLQIHNTGDVPHTAIADLYLSARALIFPSTVESFGLPLIEARRLGLPIVASELDFVRDVVDPEQSFDPYSEISIARAVKRFLGKEEPGMSLLDPGEFLERLLSRVE
jgi:glycosyltransferase involved in cell wall biosynthesis